MALIRANVKSGTNFDGLITVLGGATAPKSAYDSVTSITTSNYVGCTAICTNRTSMTITGISATVYRYKADGTLINNVSASSGVAFSVADCDYVIFGSSSAMSNGSITLS